MKDRTSLVLLLIMFPLWPMEIFPMHKHFIRRLFFMMTEQDDDTMYIQLLVAAHSLNATGNLHNISYG